MSYERKRNNAGINKILRKARKTLSESQLSRLEPYIRHYFLNMAPDDLASLDPRVAFEIAYGHWQLAKTRARGKGLIRISNPRWDEREPSSVVEIVTDNMPFLVDSVRMELNRQGFIVNLLIHPVFEVERDRQGALKNVQPPGQPQGEVRRESFIHAQIGRVLDPEQLQALETGLQRALQDVRRAVTDWRKMGVKLHALIRQLEDVVARIPPRYMDEVRAFLRWLDERNFTFLGFQEYSVVKDAQKAMLEPVKGSALGIMRNQAFSEADGEAPLLYKGGSRHTTADELLLITKSLARSSVHRPGYLDYIAVRHFDRRGRITGESRFLGLYTSMAYRRNPHDIPVVRSKIANVFAQAEFDPVSHIGKAFLHVLETFPRDELFQISENDLFDIGMGVLHLGERQRLKLFVREDPLHRFVFCLVYVPRDLYDSDLRRKMVEILLQGFQGLDLSFNVKLAEESFARVEFFIRTDPNNFPAYDAPAMEQALKEASYSWNDELRDELLGPVPERACAVLLQRYAAAFPTAYQEEFTPQTAVIDIKILEAVDTDENLKVNLYYPAPGETSVLWLKLYKYGLPIAPSDSLPVLENMGVKVMQERPYRILTGDGRELWIHDHGLLCRCGSPDINVLKPIFEEIFTDVWYGRTENDGFNALGVMAGLRSREITALRAYCKYLLQTGLTFSQAYMEQCLIRHAGLARQLIELFTLRFDPDGPASWESDKVALEKDIATQLDAISSLDEDRILRNFLGAILATIRTNYFQTDGEGNPKPYIAFKLESARVPELPEPRPLYEVFVYSPKVEGVHLRGGKVARGGIRWSDRREDFRTEVLGLVKAQKVKNAVIVPTGAKGGFFVKQPPEAGGREALMEEAVACYRQFISGLLDITDNLEAGKPVPPPRVVRYDGDDPYLVVAADKGTATFSDYANELAERYGFWLGDAFASGGSRGYDHKKMGITARGAWESVKLLFRDLGKNIQAEDFTVIGIGDMSGDVFGNGMLLSRHIRLLGAFNHMHIFLDPDPDPDPAAGFKERQRLFRMSRSTWADYNPDLISKGGGVYPRSAKSISLSSQAQALLGTHRASMTPNEVIRLLLKAPVDLLWNGGIGTYVKASTEQHADAGDRGNDAVRVNADELRCKVVGEGGNLGLTQKARVEFALRGGRIDTDFIHNAAGVNCSDHEVNIKILLNPLKAEGGLKENQRVKLLGDMTDEVADLVLQSNYWQEQAITLIEAEAPSALEQHARYMRQLENSGQLSRSLEGLPNDDQLVERKAAGLGLTRPEIAVLVSYSKIIAETELVDSDLWEDPYFEAELLRYFPPLLQKRYPEQIPHHPLRREILATHVANRMINRMGCAFVFSMQEETGATTAEITRAYTISSEVFGMRQLWRDAAALDNKVPADVQNDLMLEAAKLVYRAGKWLIRQHKRALEIGRVITAYGEGAAMVCRRVPQMLAVSKDPLIVERLGAYREQNIDESLVMRIVGMDAWYCAFDIVDIGKKVGLPLETVMDTYFGLSAYLDIYWLRVKIREYKSDGHWQELARKALVDDLYDVLRRLTAEVLRTTPDTDPQQRIAAWQEQNRAAVERYLRVPQDLKAAEHLDLAMFSVSVRELQNLYQACAAT